MTCQQIIDKVANDRVLLVSKLRDNPANQSATAPVPFQIDRTMQISRAVDFRPTMRTSRLFRPNFDEAKFRLQLRIVHYFMAQRFATARYDLNHCLHSNLDSAGKQRLCNVCLMVGCDRRARRTSRTARRSVPTIYEPAGH